MVAFLVVGRGGELRHPHVPRVERWTSRLIAPPLPEASQPSNTTHSGGPIRCSPSLPAEQQAQLEQPSLSGLELLLSVLLAELGAQIDGVESRKLALALALARVLGRRLLGGIRCGHAGRHHDMLPSVPSITAMRVNRER